MVKFSLKIDLSLTREQVDNFLWIVRRLVAIGLMSLPSVCALW